MVPCELPLAAGLLDAWLDRLRAALELPHTGLLVQCLTILSVSAVGVFLMLPRGQPAGRRLQRYVGGALATLGLVLLVTAPVSTGGASPPTGGVSAPAAIPQVDKSQGTILWALQDQPFPACWTFHILAALSLASAVMMITTRNPVYSALWFAMVLLANSGLFLLQGAEFLSAATIIVYAGAIVVTFLFVIMLAQPAGTASYDRQGREPLLASLTGLILASALVGTLHYAARHEVRGGTAASAVQPAVETIASVSALPGARDRTDASGHVAGLGRALFLEHVVSVEVIGLVLLVAVVGAMLIAGHGPGVGAAAQRTDGPATPR